MKTPLTKARLRQHWNYNWWKYLLLAVLTLGFWNIMFTVTAYRPPAEKIVDLYVYGYADIDPLTAYMDKVHQEQMPDMEQMLAQEIIADDQYGPMILSTRLAAGEGDVYVLPKTQFQGFVNDGAFVMLDDQTDIIALLEGNGVNLERCWRMDTETRERHLFGLPVNGLPGLSRYVGNNSGEDMFVCVLTNNGNPDNTIKFLNILINDMSKPIETEAAPAAAQ